jgi:hypothetical protein
MKKTSRVAAKKKAEKKPDGPPKINVYVHTVLFIEPISVPGQSEPATKYVNAEKDPYLMLEVHETRVCVANSQIKGVIVSVPISNVRQITYKAE